MNKIIVSIYLFFFVSLSIQAQKGGIPLANEYYNQGEYQKAVSIYKNFTNKAGKNKAIYDKYLECLDKLGRHEKAETYIKNTINQFPHSSRYKIDLANLYLKMNEKKKAQKQFKTLIKTYSKEKNRAGDAAGYLIKLGFYEEAEKLYRKTRENYDQKDLFAFELAELYKIKEDKEAMFRQLMMVLKYGRHDKEYMKNKLQNYITTDEEFEHFERLLYEKVQDNPEELFYNELLVWLNIQQKNFSEAFRQAKAYDKRKDAMGEKSMEVGEIALENDYYEMAADIFSYIEDQYPESRHYSKARRLKIKAREELVKNTYPVDISEIRVLIGDYKDLIGELRTGHHLQLEIKRSMAKLYAFYLDDKDTAISILKNLIDNPHARGKFLARCKVDLADIYLIENNPWDATLLYSQVEKAFKETTIGHKAKLKNAKLSYYKGDFEWAREHLDVLKLATSREIANDAMELSLLIQDNTALDTSYAAMKTFASVELLVFQHKLDSALLKYKQMLHDYPDHSLRDEIYYKMARIYQRTGKYKKAIEKLEVITRKHNDDIYSDDAAFNLAKIYEEQVQDPEKAKELYKQFMLNYKGSIYMVEARKRFRKLRGDKVN